MRATQDKPVIPSQPTGPGATSEQAKSQQREITRVEPALDGDEPERALGVP